MPKPPPTWDSWTWTDEGGRQIGGVLRYIGVGGKYGGDRLADITHLLARQHGLAVGIERGNWTLAEIYRRQIGDVGRGPHRHHPGQRARRHRVDRDNPAMGAVR